MAKLCAMFPDAAPKAAPMATPIATPTPIPFPDEFFGWLFVSLPSLVIVILSSWGRALLCLRVFE
jgi:hypothetical protein